MTAAERAHGAGRWRDLVSRAMVAQVNRVGVEAWNYGGDPAVSLRRSRAARMLARAADRSYVADCRARGVPPEPTGASRERARARRTTRARS